MCMCVKLPLTKDSVDAMVLLYACPSPVTMLNLLMGNYTPYAIVTDIHVCLDFKLAVAIARGYSLFEGLEA